MLGFSAGLGATSNEARLAAINQAFTHEKYGDLSRQNWGSS